MQTLASRCVPVRMAVLLLLFPGIPSWGHGILESSSSSPELPTRHAGTRLYLLRHTDRIDFADHKWVGSSGSGVRACTSCSSVHSCQCLDERCAPAQVGETGTPYDPYITPTGHRQAARIGLGLRTEGISRVSESLLEVRECAQCSPRQGGRQGDDLHADSLSSMHGRPRRLGPALAL